MFEVFIPYRRNSQVIESYSGYHDGGRWFRALAPRQEICEWLNGVAPSCHYIHEDRISLGTFGPRKEEGLVFGFRDGGHAALFKLTWSAR